MGGVQRVAGRAMNLQKDMQEKQRIKDETIALQRGAAEQESGRRRARKSAARPLLSENRVAPEEGITTLGSVNR